MPCITIEMNNNYLNETKKMYRNSKWKGTIQQYNKWKLKKKHHVCYNYLKKLEQKFIY